MSRLKEPAVSRRTLKLTAGTLWALVGVFLAIRALLWLPLVPSHAYIPVLIGVGLGIAKGIFVFARLARKNIARIDELSPHKERICVFAFQAILSYLIIVIMVTLGILLRLSPIPREVLVAVYLVVGIGLGIGSLSYFRSVSSPVEG